MISIEVLPQDSEGRTYITDEMILKDPNIGEFYERTRNSWHRDEQSHRYILHPTVGKSF